MGDRSLWFTGPSAVELRDDGPVSAGEGEVVVRARASGVSQGTELLLYRGEGPEPFDPSMATATYPCRYGYAWVGVVEGTNERVFALAPHAERHVLPRAALRALPAGVPDIRATLAANLETAVTCAWDAAPSFGDDVVIFGGGVVGVLTAWLLAKSASSIALVEPSPLRRVAASALVPSLRFEARAADVVVEASGRPEVLDAAIATCRPEGRVVVASFYGKRRAPVDLGETFHRRRLSLVASQVSSIPPLLRARWDVARRWELVTSLLHDPTLDALFAQPVRFEDAPSFYPRLSSARDLPPAHVFVYR